MGKTERTRQRIQECALDEFERHGFEATTVARIAASAGVSSMTFFRYFPTKESAVVWDPFDPVIAESVAAEAAPTAVGAACRGIRRAWAGLDTATVEPVVRRRTRLVADSPALRAAMWSGHADTQAALVAVLSPRFGTWAATAAAGACLGALTSVLLAWATTEPETPLSEAIARALHALDPEPTP